MSIHILAVGMNYPGTSSELGGCVNDARDVADTFAPYCETTKVLVNSRATRKGILSAGNLFLSRLKPGDLGIMSISGHGTRERGEKGFNEAIVCHDFELLWDTELSGMLAKRAQGSVLAVLADTCHSGGLPRGSGGRIRMAAAATRVPRSIPMSRCKRHPRQEGQKLRALPNVIAYLACKADEFAYDASFSGRGNGAMTRYLIDSLEMKTTETFGKLFKKVTKHLPSEDYPQTPVVVASDRWLARTLGQFRKGTA